MYAQDMICMPKIFILTDELALYVSNLQLHIHNTFGITIDTPRIFQIMYNILLNIFKKDSKWQCTFKTDSVRILLLTL